MELVLPLCVWAVLVLPWLSLPLVERYVARDPAWLAVSEADILLSDRLFGGYAQDQYAMFLLALLILSAIAGALAGYLLLRRFLPNMVRGSSISNAAIAVRAFGDVLLAIPLSLGVVALVVWIAGAPPTDAPYLGLFVWFVLGGYILGSAVVKAAIGTWWRRAVRRSRLSGAST